MTTGGICGQFTRLLQHQPPAGAVNFAQGKSIGINTLFLLNLTADDPQSYWSPLDRPALFHSGPRGAG